MALDKTSVSNRYGRVSYSCELRNLTLLHVFRELLVSHTYQARPKPRLSLECDLSRFQSSPRHRVKCAEHPLGFQRISSLIKWNKINLSQKLHVRNVYLSANSQTPLPFRWWWLIWEIKRATFLGHTTRSEYFACQDGGLSQIFKLIVPTSEKILHNINECVAIS